MEQRSEEWLAIKRGKVSSSMVTPLMAKRGLGAGAQTYAKHILSETIQEFFEENYVSPAMQNGIDLEPLARERYEQEKLNEVTQIAWVEHKDGKQGTSPDGLVYSDGMIEIKCPGTEQHMSNLLATECPAKYHDQIQHQMYITGRKYNDFVSYNPYFKAEHQIKIIRVEASEEWVEIYEERYAEFQQLIINYKQLL